MTEMSTDEVKAVRWVEHVLAPLLVLGFVGLATCTAGAQDDLIILQATVAQISKVNGETKASIKAIEKDANDTKVNIGKIESNQEHFKEQITTIQNQNSEILRIIREQ
jgi:septal ring factor EnvC (AmiA/AmiB activator)